MQSAKLAQIFFTSLLLLQVIPSGIILAKDVSGYYSAGKNVAEYLRENTLVNDKTFLAVYPSYLITSVIPYLEEYSSTVKVGLYTLDFQKDMSFVIWNRIYKSNSNLAISKLVKIYEKQFSSGKYSDGYLIVNSLYDQRNFLKKFELIRKYDQAFKEGESMYIYKYKPAVKKINGSAKSLTAFPPVNIPPRKPKPAKQIQNF